MKKAETKDAFEVAHKILASVRLADRIQEERWADEVIGCCHVWGDFYGPATSPHLARAIAHRYLDRQGGSLDHLLDALHRYGAR